ncbi:MAG: ABC transporter ATP-binding protein [Oscillospiraceae bacterium]|jgi:oligopeptide transport system ATP-binding protein|nr:ABC transporter ATP-binding protein [Oscillospiraceae bacterium]
MNENKLIEVDKLVKHFPVKAGLMNTKQIKAVDGVSLYIKKGETLGLVGESGCGKSTLGRTILRLYEPTSGRVLYNGTAIFDGNSRKQPKALTFRRKMQIIFQDPSASLNGRMTVGEIVREPLEIHGLFPNKAERANRVEQLLELVGLNSEHANRYPHEFSGGQQQRVGIARALAVEPDFIVCDEPISALDVSIQSQIVNMLEDMQERLGLTYLFIAHDLSVVKHISDRVAVMYLGKIVELAAADDIHAVPAHPYTKTLLSAIPIPDPRKSKANKRIILEGDIPSAIDIPPGCRFHTRCPYADKPECREREPELREVSPGHFAACHFVN